MIKQNKPESASLRSWIPQNNHNRTVVQTDFTFDFFVQQAEHVRAVNSN